jgi:hypothetical protein
MPPADRTEASTKYRAPVDLRGRSMRLIDGQRLEIPGAGLCAPAPSRRGRNVISLEMHRQLIAAGFRRTEG